MARRIPLSSMKNTALIAAVLLWPGWIIPYFLATFMSRSAMMGNGMSTPIFSFTFLIQARCECTESIESPINCTLSDFNSSAIAENAMNSVVHTGVKSAGWENSTSHFPLKSESFTMPFVVSASKSGAGSPRIGIALDSPHIVSHSFMTSSSCALP